MRERVVVVGGGISGLVAALELSGKYDVTVLEARDRIGGRIHTARGPGDLPFELGAEFVHGKAPETWRFIKEAKLQTHVVPDRHWRHRHGTLVEVPDFWEQLASVTQEISARDEDKSFAQFLQEVRKPREAVEIAKGFVEGFHAAPLEQASIQALRLTEESSEEIDGQTQLRITQGYGRFVDHVQNTCRKAGVQMCTVAEVLSIDWASRPATLRVKGRDTIEADRIIVTLPVGVLKSGAIEFTPLPASKIEAVEALDMGIVTKVVLHFRERFWPEPNFGFIHSEGELFGAWWADERGDIITGWAAGPKGRELALQHDAFIVERALESVSKLFGERLNTAKERLLSANTHNWFKDAFSRGAYSYIPVNGTDACRELAKPEEGRLFFAGEATDLNYQFGTVHGAIASGIRAARDLRAA